MAWNLFELKGILEPPDWTTNVEHLQPPNRPLRAALPCCGVVGSKPTFAKMKIKTESVNVYDLDPGYKAVLDYMFKDEEARPTVNLGEIAGDLTRIKLKDAPVAELLMAGPPCPPWAGMGQRKGSNDARAKVFERVLQWVVHMIRAGRLKACCIENVIGILHAQKGNAPFMDNVLEVLRR